MLSFSYLAASLELEVHANFNLGTADIVVVAFVAVEEAMVVANVELDIAELNTCATTKEDVEGV